MAAKTATELKYRHGGSSLTTSSIGGVAVGSARASSFLTLKSPPW